MEVLGVMSCCIITFLFQVFSCTFAEDLASKLDKRAVMFSTYDESTRVEHVYSHEDSYRDTAVNAASQLQIHSGLLVVEFPSHLPGQRRRKREWVIPPYNIAENTSGKFPKQLFPLKAKIEGVSDSEILYSISGEGADQPPLAIFHVDKNTGYIFVTQPLDREKKALYELSAHAFSADGKRSASPTNLTFIVTDQNDNRPVFTENPFNGQVSEAGSKGYEFMTVNATDADDPDTENGIVHYKIVGQEPQFPKPNMFDINVISGRIFVQEPFMDREKWPRYTLLIVAADMKGNGMETTGTAVITITDSNDNPPQFEQISHVASVPENKVGYVVATLPVTDDDEVGSPAWSTKYRIISGDKGGFFSVTTGPSQQEGIITTVKPLDFEKTKQYVLSVIVENDDPFVGSLPTSTATVTVNVEDVNEPPEFKPRENLIFKPEDAAVGTELVTYTATDPDIGKSQKITYKISKDPADWLNVNQDTGVIKVKNIMDRESASVKDGKYRAIILALDDDDKNPATGTGTLVIELGDVNDSDPIINEERIDICNREATVHLSITDKDGSPHADPFRVEPQGDTKKNWTAVMNETKTGILLTLKSVLEQGGYTVVLRVYDNSDRYKDNSIQATVCDCKGDEFLCQTKIAGAPLSLTFGTLAAVLVLLLLLLLLLLFIRKKQRSIKKPLLLEEDDIRDNVYCYNEEGGGEDDQNYDLRVLHRGLDNRPKVLRNDVVPIFHTPQYRDRPTNPEEIATFIGYNLKTADEDPSAPPYDSLLVFDYEGTGSIAGSLSSLNSSSSGNDQDYDFLNEWGPRFKKLADMFGGGEIQKLFCVKYNIMH